MSELNPQQRAAIQELQRPLLVLAGAGSGKTRVITEKIAHLIEQGMPARNIFAITFTNRAAREMQERISRRVPADRCRGLRVSTFHSLGLDILKTEQRVLRASALTIFDEHDRNTLLQDLLQESGSRADADPEVLAAVGEQIREWKNSAFSEAQAQALKDPAVARAAQVYQAYSARLQACNAVDFDDLIYRPVRLLESDPQCLERWQNRTRYLLVDEYQDTNLAQYRMVRLLGGPLGRFTVVGDDDQSIYAWRGARPENLADLARDYPRLEVIKLEQNYRSSGRILRVANELIGNNPHVFEKKLWSRLGPGANLRVLDHRSEEKEAQQVASEIVHHKFRTRAEFGDYAILYRSNHQSRPIERALREHNVPYTLSGGDSFFNQVEVRDVLCYLRLLCNPDDNAAFLRVVNTPRRGIGSATLEVLGRYAAERNTTLFRACDEIGLRTRLAEAAADRLAAFHCWIRQSSERLEQGPLFAGIERFLDETGYEAWLKDSSASLKTAERRYRNVQDLLRWLESLRADSGESLSLAERLAKITLLDVLERNEQQNESDRVQLMTLHSAKGLEFGYVHLVGMEENLLPHQASIENDNIEEERRLAYVGITRAKKEVTLHYCTHRKRYGEMQTITPSRFLLELPAEDMQWKGRVPENAENKRQTDLANLAGLKSLLGTDSDSG